MILGKKEPVKLIFSGQEVGCDEIIELRDRVISVLQNRSKPINKRIGESCGCLGFAQSEINLNEWVETLLELERLDEKWTETLLLLKKNMATADFNGFKRYMESREHEYEQLLVYIIYRYFANSFDTKDALTSLRFAEFAYRLIYNIGAVMFTVNGKFDFCDQIEIVRMFSSEIEYSDENIDIIFKELQDE